MWARAAWAAIVTAVLFAGMTTYATRRIDLIDRFPQRERRNDHSFNIVREKGYAPIFVMNRRVWKHIPIFNLPPYQNIGYAISCVNQVLRSNVFCYLANTSPLYDNDAIGKCIGRNEIRTIFATNTLAGRYLEGAKIEPATIITGIRGAHIHKTWTYRPTHYFLPDTNWFSPFAKGIYGRNLASDVGTQLSYREKALVFHLDKLAVNSLIGGIQKISTYSGGDRQQAGKEPHNDGPSRYPALIFIWTFGVVCAWSSIIIMVYVIDWRFRKCWIIVAVALAIVSFVCGWIGASLLGQESYSQNTTNKNENTYKDTI